MLIDGPEAGEKRLACWSVDVEGLHSPIHNLCCMGGNATHRPTRRRQRRDSHRRDRASSLRRQRPHPDLVSWALPT